LCARFLVSFADALRGFPWREFWRDLPWREIPGRSRRTISTHRKRRREIDRKVSDRSRRGLDFTNFFLADVQMGFGSFLAFYLAGLGWSTQDVGFALTVGGLAAVAAQIPGGQLADAVHWKRGLAVLGVALISVSALILALRPTWPLVIAAEVLHGVTAGLVGPAVAAISLGLVGRAGMALRAGRNFRFAASGNVLTALAMGALGTWATNHAIFLGIAALCIPAMLSIAMIRPDEIDYARARNAGKRDNKVTLARVIDLRKNWKLILFGCCMMLFHLSNASLLPLVAQNLGHGNTAHGPMVMAGLLAVPQVVVALLAPWIGYGSELWGRKPLLLAAFAIETARALLFMLTSDPNLMMAVQLLDGLTGAVINVIMILIITDLTAGSGRFNLAQGVIGTMTGVAAAISTSVFGLVVQHAGGTIGFLAMAAVTGTGLAALALLLPETKPAKYD